ncbi:thiaminase II [Rossellomorea vietnamensis]|uniref:Aminopyrimidine aminohydrolase n=1 Tax=Rossellomorea vietnamensis TaxID=218284 RepID=A0A5D4KEY1_9BACI|nr:thiaminase II [Rossellomorea vietnamensis]TYR75874.1 thiaminase II [Rossellomorea vietnamensis]
MKFTDRLYQKVQPIWNKNHQHPFVQGIGQGTLDRNKFRFYMIQDYVYLIDFAKLFALGAVKARDPKTMGEFAKLLDSTLNEEMALHRQYAERFGISTEELETAAPSPVTLAYSHYMLHVSENGTLAELVCALLPCMWSYWEIGKDLNTIDGAASHEFYGEWVSMYSSDEFGSLSLWLISLLNRLAAGKSEEELMRLEEIFLNTSRFEFMFWDMAWNEEMWPADD